MISAVTSCRQLALCLTLSIGALPAYGQERPSQVAVNSALPPQQITDSQHFLPRQLDVSQRAVAAEGYCLPTLCLEGKWVPGDSRIRVTHGDKQYLFADLRHRDIFLAAPERYLPVLDGDCLVTYAETDRRVPGNLEQGLVHRGRVYFFASSEQLASFQAEPEKYLTADLLNDGNCIVSKVDEHRIVPGLPDSVLTVAGLRLFFASAFHRSTFLASPAKYLEALGEKGFGTDASKIAAVETRASREHSSAADRMIASTQDTPPKHQESTRAAEEDSARTAMGGYCPVTIQTQGIWKLGRRKYAFEFDGRSYHMAGATELATFGENPLKYVPVLSGDCITTYVETRTRVPGSAYHTVQSNGRLYLFAGAAEKATCEREPDRYLNADLVLGGLSAVSYVDDQIEVQGSPDFETLYHGKRYWFTSKEELQKFLEQPQNYNER